MIEENAELKSKLAKITADHFDLDHKLKQLTIENNQLTEQNELLSNSEAHHRAQAKAA
jgi:predicted nuclease with TOPRIM domain